MIDYTEPPQFQKTWSCEKLSLDTQPELPQVHFEHIGPSLFCFALVRPVQGDLLLAKQQHGLGAGIFACNSFTLFSNMSIGINPGAPKLFQTTPISGSLECPRAGPHNSPLNAEIFMRVWKRVFDEGKYEEHDWTVKVDIDSVFLARGIRKHVTNYMELHAASPDERVYFNNCKAGLHGALEIISRGGMWFLKVGLDACARTLKNGYNHYGYGESVFFRNCMALLVIKKVDDFGLLTDPDCEPFPARPRPCVSGKVAFHPLRTVEEYAVCLQQAMQ